MARPMVLSLQSRDAEEPARRGRRRIPTLLASLLALLLVGLGYLGWEIRQRMLRLEWQVAELTKEARTSTMQSALAVQRALQAEAAARDSAEGRKQAEATTETAQKDAEAARSEATSARDQAAQAQAEAARVRKQADAELDRLNKALGQIAETQRTALGVVMKLGGDHLKFEFDKAELRPKDRELLSRVAGILLTSKDYTVSVNGYTDDVGSEEYNQKLSERRAQAVRDYLAEAGLPAEILSVSGHGKSLPLVKGTSEEARAKNRRVELGIASVKIRYGSEAR